MAQGKACTVQPKPELFGVKHELFRPKHELFGELPVSFAPLENASYMKPEKFRLQPALLRLFSVQFYRKTEVCGLVDAEFLLDNKGYRADAEDGVHFIRVIIYRLIISIFFFREGGLHLTQRKIIFFTRTKWELRKIVYRSKNTINNFLKHYMEF